MLLRTCYTINRISKDIIEFPIERSINIVISQEWWQFCNCYENYSVFPQFATSLISIVRQLSWLCHDLTLSEFLCSALPLFACHEHFACHELILGFLSNLISNFILVFALLSQVSVLMLALFWALLQILLEIWWNLQLNEETCDYEKSQYKNLDHYLFSGFHNSSVWLEMSTFNPT